MKSNYIWNKNLFLKNEILEFKFNEVNNKQKSLNINKDAFKRIGINKFEDFVEIWEKDMVMIKADKIINKKELYFISEKQNFISNKTIELNRKGIFNNIKLIIKEGKIFIEAINDIKKR